MQLDSDILIIGGGIAGLTAALHLHKLNFKVVLIEKTAYPHHKVCGEYVSNEVLPYLQWLGVSFDSLHPLLIDTLEFTSGSGNNLKAKLPLGGFGLSRYAMDFYLYQQLLERNIEVVFDTVAGVKFLDGVFSIETAAGNRYKSRQVLAGFGKRSSLDVKFGRDFIRRRSPYLAVKAHYRGEHESNVVGLHSFSGGYCGVSQIENGNLNVCYITDYRSFEPYRNITSFQQGVLYENGRLKKFFDNAEMVFQDPLTIGQISFQSKQPVLDHMLMIGDAAGLIHPLCGNGMAMAMHGAKIAAEITFQLLSGTKASRKDLEALYTRRWNSAFKTRLWAGRILSDMVGSRKIQHLAVATLGRMPTFFDQIIRLTHGRPLTINH